MNLKSKWMLFALLVSVTFQVHVANGRQDDADQTEWQRFQDSDLPKKIVDLKPLESVPLEDNAAWWLSRAREGVLAIDTLLGADFDFDALGDPGFIEKYNAAIAENPKTIELLLKAATSNGFRPNRNFAVDTFAEFDSQIDVNEMRSVARVMMYRSSVEFAQGRTESAVESALVTLRLSRHDAMGFGLSGHLIRKVISSMGLGSLNQILQSGKPIKPESLLAICKELESHDTLDDFQRCFDSERVLGLQLIKDQSLQFSEIDGEAYLKTIRIIQQNANKSIADQAELLGAADKRNVTAMMIYPAVEMSRSTANRVLTQVRCLRLLIELNEQTNERPALEDLNLPRSAMTDPISGNPLVYRKLENGWLVYGVGRNHKDDGGDVYLDQDYGFTSVVGGK